MITQSVCVCTEEGIPVCVLRTIRTNAYREGSLSAAKQHVPFSGAELLRMEPDTSEVFITQTDILIMPLWNSKNRINVDL